MTRHRSRSRSPRAHPTSSFIRKVSLSFSLSAARNRGQGVIFLGKGEEGADGGPVCRRWTYSYFFPFNIRAVPRHCSLSWCGPPSIDHRSLGSSLIGNHSHTANCQSPVVRIGFHPIQLSSLLSLSLPPPFSSPSPRLVDSARVRSCYPDYPEIRQIETIDGTYIYRNLTGWRMLEMERDSWPQRWRWINLSGRFKD